jgi:hypothetical protein
MDTIQETIKNAKEWLNKSSIPNWVVVGVVVIWILL